MKKRSIILAALILACICVFSACKKQGLVIKNGSGENIAVTDENGSPVYDEAGNIIVIDTDENGKPKKDKDGNTVTKPVAHDEIILSGKTMHTPYYSMPVPSGYKAETFAETLSLSKGDDSIDIDYDVQGIVESKEYDRQEMIAAMKEHPSASVETNVTEVTVCGEKVNRTEIKIKSVDNDKSKQEYIVSYIFSKNGVVYSITVRTPDFDIKLSTVEAIINTISFK